MLSGEKEIFLEQEKTFFTVKVNSSATKYSFFCVNDYSIICVKHFFFCHKNILFSPESDFFSECRLRYYSLHKLHLFPCPVRDFVKRLQKIAREFVIGYPLYVEDTRGDFQSLSFAGMRIEWIMINIYF